MNTFSNNKWSNLPTHKPNPVLWDKIETDLDLNIVSSNIDQLPEHTPKMELWNSIDRSLNFLKYLRYFYIAGATAIVAVAIYFGISTKEKAVVNITSNNLKQNIVLNHNNIITTKNNPIALDNNSSNTTNDVKDTKIVTNRNENTKQIQSDVSKNDIKQPIDNGNNSIIKEKNYSNNNTTSNNNNNNNLTNNKETTFAENSNTKIKENNIVAAEVKTEAPTLSDNNNTISTDTKSQQNNVAESKVEKVDLDTTNKVIESSTKNKSDIAKVPISKLDIAKSSKEKQWYYSLGIDYSFNAIKNNEKFSYSNTKNISQYGISGKITYANWIFQTGVNFSSFSDKLKYNSEVQYNKYYTYQYVDSVIYPPSSGAISQYITHSVTVNDSIKTTLALFATKKYSILNIPVLVGYQWRFDKASLTLKTGVQCSFVISEKEDLQQAGSNNIILLELHHVEATLRKVNFAGVVSLEIGYNFYKHLGISVEPILQYYFNPQYKEMDKNSGLPYTIGIKTGLFYNF